MKIRSAKLNDFERLLPLFHTLYSGDLGPNFENTFENFVLDKNCSVLIAETSEAVVGFLVGSYHLDIDWEGKIGKIDATFVEEKFRRKGVGIKLAKTFLEKAKRDKCRAVVLRVNRKNTTACQFYEKLGFTKTETYEYILELL